MFLGNETECEREATAESAWRTPQPKHRPFPANLYQKRIDNRKQEVELKLKTFREYLTRTGTTEALCRTMVDLCKQNTDMPTDPIRYLRENVGLKMSEAKRGLESLAKAKREERRLEREKERLTAKLEQLILLQESDTELDIARP